MDMLVHAPVMTLLVTGMTHARPVIHLVSGVVHGHLVVVLGPSFVVAVFGVGVGAGHRHRCYVGSAMPDGGVPLAIMTKVTAPAIRDRKGGPKISMVTVYDYPGAVIADRAGIDIALIGDSVANVVHGMETTLEIGLDEIVLHTRAVKRARPNALVVADMPWLSFHLGPEDAVRNAGRLVQEGGAEAWTAGRVYEVGATVTRDGVTYQCLQTHQAQGAWAPAGTPALWQRL